MSVRWGRALVLAGLLAFAAPAEAKTPKRRNPRATKASPQVSPPMSVSGPTIDGAALPAEDLDVSQAPPPAPLRRAAAAPEDKARVEAEGERFDFRTQVGVARYRYDEQGQAPLQFENMYVDAGLEISRRIFQRWVLGASVGLPVVALESAGAVNFGPLFARFSVGRHFSFSERWDGVVTLSYLFQSSVGRRGNQGYVGISGVEAGLRARFHESATRVFEIDVGAAFLGSREAGIVTGDRSLRAQVAYLWQDVGYVRALGPFVSVDETKAQFADKRTAGARFRLGLVVDL